MDRLLRIQHQWHDWLTRPLGRSLMQAERHDLTRLLADLPKMRSALLGVPAQIGLLQTCHAATTRLLLAPFNLHDTTVVGHFHAVPLATASMDLVILPHTLEYTQAPHQTLQEACRIVRPEGHIVILGFNPYGIWALRKLQRLKKSHSQPPWSRPFLARHLIMRWLRQANFSLVRQDMLLFRPPLLPRRWFERLGILEWIGKKLFQPWGGVYVLIAKTRVVPLTPMRLQWKDTLPNLTGAVPLSPLARNKSDIKI